ncbi:MAG: AEC family transporter [Chitinophagales bacterium]|nr:AEC family transporter [Chitinophagales bacterium]
MAYPILLVSLFILGWIVKQFSFTPKTLYKKINKFIIYLPLPAITLTKIPFLELSSSVVFPIASAWIIFFCCIAFAIIMGKIFNFSKATMACIILSCGLGNTSFVGFPILEHFYGKESIQYAIFVDQPGSFLIMSTLGILVAVYASSGNFSFKVIADRLFKFPPFICFIISLIIPKTWITGTLFDVLHYIGMLMVPLAMLSLGMQFHLKLKSVEWKPFVVAISYKLLIAPLIIYVLLFIVLKKQGLMYDVTVLECAMPPMITSSIIASEYGLNEELAGNLPTLGILLCIPTLAFWLILLQ